MYRAGDAELLHLLGSETGSRRDGAGGGVPRRRGGPTEIGDEGLPDLHAVYAVAEAAGGALRSAAPSVSLSRICSAEHATRWWK